MLGLTLLKRINYTNSISKTWTRLHTVRNVGNGWHCGRHIGWNNFVLRRETTTTTLYKLLCSRSCLKFYFGCMLGDIFSTTTTKTKNKTCPRNGWTFDSLWQPSQCSSRLPNLVLFRHPMFPFGYLLWQIFPAATRSGKTFIGYAQIGKPIKN